MVQSRNILTKGEVEQLQRERIEWGSGLATALRNWCDNNGYHPRNKLGKELAIPSQTWGDLFDPRGGVCGDISVYARLHLRTGLQEASPCTIPSRIKAAPKTPGRYYEIVRAWTEEEYAQWYQTMPSPKKLVQETVLARSTSLKPEAEPQTLGSLIDRLLANSEERIALRVVEELRHEREESGDIGKQADRLFHTLEKYLDGTPEDRDRLMAQFGRTHLSRLFSLLRDLSSEDRETMLQINQRRK